MYDLQYEYHHTILHRVHHKHLKKWYETPEEFKEINEKTNLSNVEDEKSQNNFEGFDKETQGIFKINWEKVSKYNIQLLHNLEQINQDSQNTTESREIEVRIP
ncbi:UNVERIFIED_CONTAM: hypothetical protein RMT77_008302 [Armadillidium vulgare]